MRSPQTVQIDDCCPPVSEGPWYAVRLRSNFEQSASAILQEKGYTTFLPIYRSRRKWSDRVKQIELPLFPGYTFVQFDPQKKLPILVTPGVVSIVGSAEGPAPIDPSEIEAVRILLRSGLPFGPGPMVRKGHPVLVERGPLRGAEGTVIEVKNDCQLIISVSLLQRSVSVKIDRDSIRILSQTVIH